VLLRPESWSIFGCYCEPPTAPVDRPRAGQKWVPAASSGVPRVELMLVLAGRGQHRYRGRVYEYGPGTVFCYGPQERGQVELPEWAAGAEVLGVHASEQGLSARLVRCMESRRGRRTRAKRLLVVDRTSPLALNPLLHPQFIEQARPEVRPLLVRAGVELLVATIVELGYAPPDRGEEHLTRQAMRLVADFIQDVGGATDVAECARVAGCTHCHLLRLFPKFHHSLVKNYIDDYRMREAGKLLSEGWKKKDIAEYFGMSPSSFSTWLRRVGRRRPF
jgi:AraC-like DNA-binding protein